MGGAYLPSFSLSSTKTVVSHGDSVDIDLRVINGPLSAKADLEIWAQIPMAGLPGEPYESYLPCYIVLMKASDINIPGNMNQKMKVLTATFSDHFAPGNYYVILKWNVKGQPMSWRFKYITIKLLAD